MADIENKSQLDVMLASFADKLTKNDLLRDPVIAKLVQTVENIHIDFENDSPRIIEVKLATINQLDALIKSKNDTAKDIVNTTMKKKETESNINHKEASIALIKQINPKTIMNDGEAINIAQATGALDEAFKATGQEISEDEAAIHE